MKELTYKSADGRLVNKFEYSNDKELFKLIASFQETFEEGKCGKCGKSNLRFSVRNVEDNDYYERVCNDCGAKLSYGQAKKGDKLFPRRKLDDGTYDKENKGWHFYNGPTRDDNQAEVEDDGFGKKAAPATKGKR